MTRGSDKAGPVPREPRADDLDRIVAALRGLRFGAVEVVVHEGEIVQIERKEKLRFNSGRRGN